MKASYALLLIASAALLFGCSAEHNAPMDSPATGDSLTSVDHSGQEVLALPELVLHYSAREGKTLFQHYCATCHGEEGRGDGFNAFNLDPSPRDLSEPAFQGDRTNEELFELIRLGGAAAGLSNAMPPWGNTINERGIRYLISYLRELRIDPDETAEGEE